MPLLLLRCCAKVSSLVVDVAPTNFAALALCKRSASFLIASTSVAVQFVSVFHGFFVTLCREDLRHDLRLSVLLPHQILHRGHILPGKEGQHARP